jgi:hypothetical protein
MTVLDNLFASRNQDLNRVKVIMVLEKNYYKVKDDVGRISNVYSNTIWKVGDYVKVISGQIVGRSGAVTKIKTIRV